MHAQALSDRAQVHQRAATERRARVRPHPDNAHVQRHRPRFPVATRPCPGPNHARRPDRICRSRRSDRDLVVSTGAAIVSSPTSLIHTHPAPRVRYFSIPYLGRRSALPRSAQDTDASARAAVSPLSTGHQASPLLEAPDRARLYLGTRDHPKPTLVHLPLHPLSSSLTAECPCG
jgi:hypothetical protein